MITPNLVILLVKMLRGVLLRRLGLGHNLFLIFCQNKKGKKLFCAYRDSNSGSFDYEANALPIQLNLPRLREPKNWIFKVRKKQHFLFLLSLSTTENVLVCSFELFSMITINIYCQIGDLKLFPPLYTTPYHSAIYVIIKRNDNCDVYHPQTISKALKIAKK